MGVNCFGSSVPAGNVNAIDYEKASEEAEDEIRAAEEAAKKKAEEEQKNDQRGNGQNRKQSG